MKRSTFLRNLGLLTAGLSLSSPFKVLAGNRPNESIRGRVITKGKGIKNVVVSDGFSVVTTNETGMYELPYHQDAEFIFVSTPAGFEFAEKGNLAGEYTTLSSSRYDFELRPLKKKDHHHRFLVWADPQIQNQKDANQLLNESVPDVQKLLSTFPKSIPVHGIGVGDLIWDRKEMWNEYKQAINHLGIPFYQALGNHDMDYDQGGDKESDKTFKSHFGPTYYSFNRGQAHYVVLDDVRYIGPGKKYDGHISEEQLAWLEKDLQYVDPNKLLIIGLHIPVYNSVKNKEDLYRILKPFKNTHILSGHTHTNKNVIGDSIYEHVHGTVCGAWWTGSVCKDGTPRGYGVYDVKGNQLSWRYKSIGKAESFQFRTHKEYLNDNKVRLLANVWNVDPEWKVEWWEDSIFKGGMEQMKGFDPLAVKLYQGKDLPKERRGWVEPGRTDNLFMAHSLKGKNIKIQVTDRFGKKYAESISL